MDPRRFQSTGLEWWGSFLDEILVVCPKCEATALVRPREPGQATIFSPRRVSCGSCGFSRHGEQRGPGLSGHAEPMLDSYFSLPLRLQTRCGRHLLWAFNHRHLSYLEAFVQASLREQPYSSTFGWHNTGLASQLPQWMKDAHRRGAVRKAIASLRESR